METDFLKSILGIHSPSKVIEKLENQYVEEFIKGLESINKEEKL